MDVYPVHAAAVFHHRQHRRSVRILSAVPIRIHSGRPHCKRIVLLHKVASLSDRFEQLPAQHRQQLIVSIVFQRMDGTLVGQRFALSAPVIGGLIDENRIIDRHGRQRHFRPELLRIKEVALHELLCLLRITAVPVHAAKRIVNQRRHLPVAPVPVKEGSLLGIPKIALQGGLYALRLFHMAGSQLYLALDPGNLRHRFPGGIGVAHDVHRRHRNHTAALRRHFLLPRVRCILIAAGLILTGIVFAPGLEAPIAVRIPDRPQVYIKPSQRLIQLLQVVRILAGQIIHIQRRSRKAESLKLIELRDHLPVDHSDAAGNSAVSTLIIHEHGLIVKTCCQISLGIHLTAHGLGLQPDFLVASALHQDRGITEKPYISLALLLRTVHQLLHKRVVGLKCNARLHVHSHRPDSSCPFRCNDSNHPFSPLPLMPCTRYRLKIRKIKNTGISDSVDMANIAP